MTDEQEEALFEVWFHQQRRADFDRVPGYGRFEDHPNWGMGDYGAMKKAWMARAVLQKRSTQIGNERQ